MLAKELISEAIPPLRLVDNVQMVLDRMDEFRVSHLPVVNDGILLGMISDDDLIEVSDYSLSLDEASVNYNKVFLTQHQHIYEILNVFNVSKLTVLPVLDDNKAYLGVITGNTVIESLGTITSAGNSGGIIVLEMNTKNSSLAHIAQIIESEGAQVLSSYITAHLDSTRTELTLKVNRTDLSAILSSLARYDYTILATYNDNKENSGMTDRYDQLMNYLNI